MRRALRCTAWAVLVVTMGTIAMYVGLLVQRRVSPPVVPVTANNNISPHQQGDALLVRQIAPLRVTSGIVVAARLDGRVVLGRVQSLHQDGERIVYTLRGVHRSGTDDVTDRDLVGTTDRRVPLLGWPLLAARARAVQVLGGGLVVGTVLLLVFFGRTPLDFFEDEPVPFELPPPPLALPAGPQVRPTVAPMPYVGRPMSITPDDLRQVRFAQTRKGYDTEAVDRALDTVADNLEVMFNERTQIIERLHAAEAEIERLKATEPPAEQTAALAAPTGHPDATTVELLGEMRAIRALLQHALQPGGPLQQQRPPGMQ